MTVATEAAPAIAIPIASIDVKDNNGRRDQKAIAELGASMKAVGLLYPITVRPRGKRYELVAGGRRATAAGAIGWTEISAFVRELTDEQAITVRIVENDQREDIHPLDQAASYLQLQKLGLSTSAIAEMVSRPEKHVYDRLRLARLVPAAQKLFRSGKIGVEHAVQISRQKPEDQERIVALPEDRGNDLGLWRHEEGNDPDDLFEGDDEKKNADPLAGYVARTAIELKNWIDHHVRFDRNAPDLPQLFEATAANLTAAVEKREKIVPITHEYHLQDGAKDSKERTYGPQSWKRADGGAAYNPRSGRTEKSKTCESSALGIIVAGDGRGDSLRICIDEKCEVHWGVEAKESRKRKTAEASGKTERAEKLEQARREREQKEQQQAEALQARWKKAGPELVKALATAITKADAKPTGYLAKMLMQDASDWENRAFAKTLAPGKTAESLVRWLAFMKLVGDVASPHRGPDNFPAIARSLKIDLWKLLDEVAPVQKAATEAKGARGRAKRKK
jgi:ParB family chromosome partitioning protein